MGYAVRLRAEAEKDLEDLRVYISEHASGFVARSYIERLLDFLARLEAFPNRGSLRNDIMPGLRIVGFERRVAIAFRVEGSEVIVFRILYGGRTFEL